MLGYLAILGAALAGYVGVGPWVIVVSAVALAAISRADHDYAYERGRELSLNGMVDSIVVRSLCNGVIASTAAYGFGWLVRAV